MTGNNIRQRYRDPFFRRYLWYTALETDLLFFVVCDAMFLTQVKGLTVEQVSLNTFLSLVFSLLAQYPLLRFINRAGNRIAVRLGSIIFLLSSLCITFAPGFFLVLAGGFLKCIGHTLNTMGTAVMRNHLTEKNREVQYVSFQSDANSAASLVMMITSLLCGVLFRINAYYPMAACILFGIAGVISAFLISGNEKSSGEIKNAADIKQYVNDQKQFRRSHGILIFTSFATFTALTGTGLSYSRLNFQELLSGQDTVYIMTLLSIVSTLIYLFRFLSNVLMRKAYSFIREYAFVIVSVLLMISLLLQTFPWFIPTGGIAAVLFAGYLMMAFVRDPFITLMQNISLYSDDPERQQRMLIALNGAKKAGSLILAALSTLLIKYQSTKYVMILMTAAACVNIFLCFMMIRTRKN